MWFMINPAVTTSGHRRCSGTVPEELPPQHSRSHVVSLDEVHPPSPACLHGMYSPELSPADGSRVRTSGCFPDGVCLCRIVGYIYIYIYRTLDMNNGTSARHTFSEKCLPIQWNYDDCGELKHCVRVSMQFSASLAQRQLGVARNSIGLWFDSGLVSIPNVAFNNYHAPILYQFIA